MQLLLLQPPCQPNRPFIKFLYKNSYRQGFIQEMGGYGGYGGKINKNNTMQRLDINGIRKAAGLKAKFELYTRYPVTEAKQIIFDSLKEYFPATFLRQVAEIDEKRFSIEGKTVRCIIVKKWLI